MSEPKTPTSQEAKPAREIDEQTQKHIDRFLEGREAWNKWANEMLVKKEELEKAGKWKVEKDRDDRGRYRTMSADKTNPEIQVWVDEAFVDFSNICFEINNNKKQKKFIYFKGPIDEKVYKEVEDAIPSSLIKLLIPDFIMVFDEFVFPFETNFENSQFRAITNFSGTIFKNSVNFSNAKFFNGTTFIETLFQEKTNFNAVQFHSYISFEKSKFSNEIQFKKSKFKDITNLGGTEFKDSVDFHQAIFLETISFQEAKFEKTFSFKEIECRKTINFNEVNFLDKVEFSRVKFFGLVSFEKSKFKGKVTFLNTKFNETVNFEGAKFENEVYFEDTKFQSSVYFLETVFLEDVFFQQAGFLGGAIFSYAIFSKYTAFYAMKAERAFTLEYTIFKDKIPDFTQANFTESPRLDNIEIIPAPLYENYPFPSEKIQSSLKWQRYWWNLQYRAYLMRLFWRCVYKLTPSNYRKLYHKGEVLKHIWNKFRNSRRDPDEEAHYRALKRLAIQAHDHENEMKFFAGEIRARRHVTDFANFLTHDFASSMRYWAGVAYELFSDFGRSFIRPALWWFACLWLFANLTLSGAKKEGGFLEDETKCHNSQLTPKQAAYTIGLKNSLLILGLTKTNIVKQAELCLYGVNKNGDAEREPKSYDPKIKRAYQAKPTKADTTKTDIPFKAVVQGITHSLLSLLFIFLLLLAIRNQFKIK